MKSWALRLDCAIAGILATISGIYSVLLRHFTCFGCLPSCIMCTENTTICQHLTYIPAIPLTTRVLLLTNGIIPSVEKPNLANLSSLTLLKLSNNGIMDIQEDSFHGLSALTVLLLDQNQITSETITESTFTALPNLETLQLGNNGICQINGSWFRNMSSLRSLSLERNHISKLEADTFTRSSLQNLQILDLSANSIDYIDRHAFCGLRDLKWLDLSRNRLSGMADSFSHLPKLSVLNLDLNRWNCTCQLQELAVFLKNFINSPDRTLKNAKGLVCETAKSSEGQTVLQLADSNCATQSQNTTVIVTSGSYRHYARDVILTVLFCFAGAVGLTVAVATLLCNKCHHRMDPRQKNCPASEAESNHERECIFERVPRCHLTCDSEVEVMSTVSSVDHPKLSQQDMVNPKSRNAGNKERFHQQCLLNQAKEQTTEKEYFGCQPCRLVHTFRTTLTDGQIRRSGGKFSAGTTRGDRGGICWDMKQPLPHQVEGSNQGFTEALRVRNEHSGNSYYLLKKPMGIYNLGKGHCKSVPETRNIRRGQAATQLKSPSRHFPCSSLTYTQPQLGTVALVTEPFYEISHRPFPQGRIRNVELLPGNNLTGNCDSHRQFFCYSNRVPTQMNKKVRSKVKGEHLTRSAQCNVNAEPPGDNLSFANHKRNAISQYRFGKEEPRPYIMDRGSHRDRRFIDQIEILGTVWEDDRAQRQKSVTFDLPGFTDAELIYSPEAGSKTQGEGREARGSMECLKSGRRFQAEKKLSVRPCTSRQRSNERSRRLDMKLTSVDSKTRRVIQHRTSVNILMVKFILHPTKHTKVQPDEVTEVKGPLRSKKQMISQKTGLKKTYKKGKLSRKPPVCQSTGTTGVLQQAQQTKTLKQRPSATSQNEPFRQAYPPTGPDKRDRVRGHNGSLYTDLETTSRVLSPMSPTPVTDTENHKLPQSIKIPLGIHPTELQDSAPSMGPLQTPNKSSDHEAAPLAITHKTPPSLTSATDVPPPTISRNSADDHEDKEPLVQLKSSNFTFQLQEAILNSDKKGMKIQGASPLGSAPGEQQGEVEDAQEECQETNQDFLREGDWQPAPSGQSEGEGQIAKEQTDDQDSMSIMGMAESDMDGMVKGTVDKPPNDTTPSISVTGSDTDWADGQAQGPPPVGALSEKAATRGADGPHRRTGDGAAEPADAINHQPRSTEQSPLLSASSGVTGLRNQDHIKGRNITSDSQNGNGDHANSPLASPLQRAGCSEQHNSNVVIFSHENPDEEMVMAEPRPGDCTLLPIHNLATWDGVGDEANQRRKIRLVIPERPGNGSNNAINRKIR